MLPTIILGLALLFSIIPTLAVINKAIVGKSGLLTELFWYIIAIVLWCLFYYLTH